VSVLQRDLDPTSMAEKPALNPEPQRRKRGRPTREEATAKALAAILVDPLTIDPRQILAGIAVDRSAPAGARVAACRTLLGLSEGPDARMVAEDSVAERAIRLMAARKAH
jgi:hypothetical protein